MNNLSRERSRLYFLQRTFRALKVSTTLDEKSKGRRKTPALAFCPAGVRSIEEVRGKSRFSTSSAPRLTRGFIHTTRTIRSLGPATIRLMLQNTDDRNRTSWRRILALCWIILSIPSVLISILGVGMIQSFSIDTIIFLALPLFFVIGAVAGLKRPFSSWLVLLPVLGVLLLPLFSHF